MAPTRAIPQELPPTVRPDPTVPETIATVIDFSAASRRHATREQPDVERSMHAHPAMGSAARYA